MPDSIPRARDVRLQDLTASNAPNGREVPEVENANDADTIDARIEDERPGEENNSTGVLDTVPFVNLRGSNVNDRQTASYADRAQYIDGGGLWGATSSLWEIC